MNDEIKEILNIIECWKNGDYVLAYSFNYDRASKQNDKLLDYITNLQQELEEYKDTETYSKRFLYKANKDRLNANLDLVKENERLKEQNNDLRKTYRNTYNKLFENGNDELARYFQAQIDDCPTFYVEPIIDYAKEWKDYKSRIEKAVEYLKKHIEKCNIDGYEGKFDNFDIFTKPQKLLNILNGRSDE